MSDSPSDEDLEAAMLMFQIEAIPLEGPSQTPSPFWYVQKLGGKNFDMPAAEYSGRVYHGRPTKRKAMLDALKHLGAI